MIELTNADVLLAGLGGLMRRLHAIRKGRRDPTGARAAEKWGHDVVGALGEYAICKALGLHWDATVGRLDAADAGRLEVRCTTYLRGHLILHPRDHPDRSYILTLLHDTTIHTPGWLPGSVGMSPQYLQADARHGEAYYIPQADLYPMEQLADWKGQK